MVQKFEGREKSRRKKGSTRVWERERHQKGEAVGEGSNHFSEGADASSQRKKRQFHAAK